MSAFKQTANLSDDVLQLANSLYNFMKEEFSFTCEPKIFFETDEENANNILGRTGFYDPNKEEVHVYVTNRHPKDVLRSLAHELLHHIQGCEGSVKADQLSGTKNPNYLIHDDFLKQVEADAFERGNVAFRKWEAYIKEGKINVDKLEEKAKIPKKKLSKYKTKLRKIADKIHKDEPDMPDEKKFRIAAAAAKKAVGVKKEEVMKENKQPEKEVQINDALKDSHYYVPEDRALATAYNMRDEKIYNDLLKKFKIKK